MNAWIVRAVALGGLIVAARVLLGFTMVHWPTDSGPPRLLLFVVVLAAPLWWGVVDGRKDRTANPAPEDGEDLTITWLRAGAAAGLGGGAVAWLLGLIPQVEVGGNTLLFELTSSAAFVVLIVFLPAMLGVALGRRLVGRTADKAAAG